MRFSSFASSFSLKIFRYIFESLFFFVVLEGNLLTENEMKLIFVGNWRFTKVLRREIVVFLAIRNVKKMRRKVGPENIRCFCCCCRRFWVIGTFHSFLLHFGSKSRFLFSLASLLFSRPVHSLVSWPPSGPRPVPVGCRRRRATGAGGRQPCRRWPLALGRLRRRLLLWATWPGRRTWPSGAAAAGPRRPRSRRRRRTDRVPSK
jgi:hypothetical protein